MITIRRTQAAILPFRLRRYVPDVPTYFDTEDNQFQQTVAIMGPPGRDGSGANSYEHVQSSPAVQWTVNHNFGRRPSSVRVLTPGGVEMEAQVTEMSLNQVVVTFLSPTTGSVIVI